MASVAFDRVNKVFPDGTRAVDDCTLAIADGELMVVVGPSGCGKSTLLRLVAGLEQPTSGTIRLGERVVNALKPQDRNVAMVFQDYALYPYLSARGNLEFPLRMRKLRRDEMQRRVDHVARLLDITGLLDRLPKQLSGGQRQRVAMGRALVREPAAFLLDEPLSNLDAKLRVQVRAEIKELQQRTGTTMMYVTHDQVEAMTLGDRVTVLRAGRLQQVAAPRTLYDHPANAFVAGFIGMPPMNLFPARVEAAQGGHPALAVAGQRLSTRPRAGLVDGVAVTAGIRPEAFRLETDANATLRATVEHVECLGHETLAYVRLGAAEAPEPVRLTARLDGMPALAKGETIALGVDPERVYLFGENGEAIPG